MEIKNIRFILSETGIIGSDSIFSCEIDGEKKELTYTTYLHDDGYGFGLYVDGIGIHNEMSERDALELEGELCKVIEVHNWIEKIKECKTLEELDYTKKDFMYNEDSYLRDRDDIRPVLIVFEAKEFELEVGIKCVNAVVKLTTENINQIEWYSNQKSWGETRMYSISAYLKCLQDMDKIPRDDAVNLCMFYKYGIIAKYYAMENGEENR